MEEEVGCIVKSSLLALLQVGSNAGIVGMTKEHLGLALALNVPVFVVVTKIDMCPANILQGKCATLLPLTAISWVHAVQAACVNAGTPLVHASNRDAKAAPEATQVPRL